MAEAKKFYGTGRRKSSIARVYITAGKGKILVNGVEVSKYMPYATLVQNLKQPLVLAAADAKYDVEAEVVGGGFTGQASSLPLTPSMTSKRKLSVGASLVRPKQSVLALPAPYSSLAKIARRSRLPAC